MIGDVYQFADLQSMCKPKPDAPPPKLATVERWLRAQGVPFCYDGQGGVWTTLEALNAALGLAGGNKARDTYDPNELG
ncbi:hypothetical protein J5226_12700 [Lysobacter sp. K5869]|uniref:hypothetical protein n=1 Tax=Lysobacter sp. K5869 TaxID=2820808 RepID=UPI001C060738|nr:hypothetical protein [Lysobacter sp. K5869]QWP79184.1 hypothetical protein J5226_12700 [Lysobacter sp. K5869]